MQRSRMKNVKDAFAKAAAASRAAGSRAGGTGGADAGGPGDRWTEMIANVAKTGLIIDGLGFLGYAATQSVVTGTAFALGCQVYF